jgi:hypothetical protein
LLLFEKFYENYNYIFGELELNVKVSLAALVLCCVDLKFSLANEMETSTLDPVMLNIRPTGAKVATDTSATLLKHYADNIIIKSNAHLYTKICT